MAKGGNFLKYYRQLNPAQRLAVDTIDGPVMVIAGPGTGKTQILTLRIANILRQTDTPADAILALTFTNAGVHAMRKRLAEIMGSRAYRVPIHTFHSFANEVIRRYPENFPRIIGATNALPIDQIKILEAAITESELELLRPYGNQFYYLFPVLQEIERLKKESVTPEKLRQITVGEREQFALIADLKHEKGKYRGQVKGKYQTLLTQIKKAEELAIIYEAYEKKLAERRLYDFADMLVEVIKALEKDKNFQLQLQEEYQYILADEHQDANQSQNRLLELLASYYEEPNLFIVGDEKQAIFQFQGASLDNFNYFRRLFPRAKLITLKENYRSTQTILNAAHSVIPAGKALHSNAGEKKPAPITVRAFAKPEQEILWLVEELKEKNKTGAPWSELAVLYRNNRDALPIIDYFERAGVPFVVRSESNILDDLDLQKLILLLRAVNDFGNDAILLEILHLDFLNIDLLDIYALEKQAREKRLSAWSLLRQSKKRRLKKLSHDLERWVKQAANQTFLDLCGAVVKESGFLDYLLRFPEAQDKIDKLHALYEEATKLTRNNHNFKLADFISFLNTLATHHLSIKHRPSAATEGVELMTAHKAKGLEFDHVYLVGVYDGNWGNKRDVNYFKIPTRPNLVAEVLTKDDKNNDERRLFYVALTRGRQTVSISYSEETEDGRLNLPSQFIEEIATKFLARPSTADWARGLGDKPNLIFSPRVHQGARLLDPEYLAARFREQGLSATGLNNYLKCPINYLFSNLLHVIQFRNKHLLYGTAVHATLEDFFNRFRADKTTGKEVLLAGFERFIAREPFNEQDLAVSRQRGARALAGWYNAYHCEWSDNILNEYFVAGCHLSPELKIKGKIDKLEFLSDKNVNIVDYKTMAPKKVTDDLYRQLVFYKILIEECDKGRFKVASAAIDFIEPTDKGKYKKEVVEISDEAEQDLRATLTRVALEITSGQFLARGCGQADCPGCRLERMMK